DGDAVAIHTLAAAAHDILHTLYRRKGLSGLIFDNRIVKKEAHSKVASVIKKTANFFKHADRDATDAVIEFDPFLTELFILVSITALERMGESLSLEERAASQWLLISRP